MIELSCQPRLGSMLFVLISSILPFARLSTFVFDGTGAWRFRASASSGNRIQDDEDATAEVLTALRRVPAICDLFKQKTAKEARFQNK